MVKQAAIEMEWPYNFGDGNTFCSCSSIPLFIGFTSAGLLIGVTFSFLISSPLVDLASVLLLTGIFNWKIAIAYVIVGVVLAVISGTIISRMKLLGIFVGIVTLGIIIIGYSFKALGYLLM